MKPSNKNFENALHNYQDKNQKKNIWKFGLSSWSQFDTHSHFFLSLTKTLKINDNVQFDQIFGSHKHSIFISIQSHNEFSIRNSSFDKIAFFSTPEGNFTKRFSFFYLNYLLYLSLIVSLAEKLFV